MKKSTISLISFLGGGIIGAIATSFKKKPKVNQNDKTYKFKLYYNMLNEWLILKYQRKSLVQYFTKNNIKKIAIYGMGEIGDRLFEELENSDIDVSYGIDKGYNGDLFNLKIVSPDESLDRVDAIVVTPIFEFDTIIKNIQYKVNCPILSLQDIIRDLL